MISAQNYNTSLKCVIVVFPDHTHFFIYIIKCISTPILYIHDKIITIFGEIHMQEDIIVILVGCCPPKAVVLLLLIHCLLLLPLFVGRVRFFLQSPRWGKESWSLYFYCFLDVHWLFVLLCLFVKAAI